MLKINRLRIEIETINGTYGLDERFDMGLNFLASKDNTCGKSSIIEGIYYCLGFEEIIGGKGEKVLTSVYKTSIDDMDKKYSVLESKIFLEISNNVEEITIFRTAKSDDRKSNLVTVYRSKLEDIYAEKTISEDYYVHLNNSANNPKGFHYFLEKFLYFNLPKVPTTDGSQRKLYLQLLFSCMFIEQKHGWSHIFSGIPYLGIKDAKKRVIEFILNLDTLDNEKKKENLKSRRLFLEKEWELSLREIDNACNQQGCSTTGIPLSPGIITKEELLKKVHILKNGNDIKLYNKSLEEQYKKLETKKLKVIDNFQSLQNELSDVEKDITTFNNKINYCRETLLRENLLIEIVTGNIEIIENDLKNNKDVVKLEKLGSKIGLATSKGVCPVCQQSIQDSLLPKVNDMNIMGVDENIRHLEAQKEMLKYALESHIQNQSNLEKEIIALKSEMFSLQKLAKIIRSDLYSVDDSISETVIYKKINIENEMQEIENLSKFIEEKMQKLLELSDEWKRYLEMKNKLPTQTLSDTDKEKIDCLKKFFVNNLKKFGYKSIVNMVDVKISNDTYLPVIKEFDMKFDSSASDNIRAIWAYTIALTQVSILKKGNHPNILIFDEPNQHSIIPENMASFFESIINLNNKCQTIVGITVKDSDTKEILEKIKNNKYKMINVNNKAFKKLY